jgi:4-hydroxybenzoate polyprenyltransferase
LQQFGKAVLVDFYVGTMLAWVLAGMFAGKGGAYWCALLLVAIHFVWQIQVLNVHDPKSCVKVFRSNSVLGLVMFLGLFLA